MNLTYKQHVSFATYSTIFRLTFCFKYEI